MSGRPRRAGRPTLALVSPPRPQGRGVWEHTPQLPLSKSRGHAGAPNSRWLLGSAAASAHPWEPGRKGCLSPPTWDSSLASPGSLLSRWSGCGLQRSPCWPLPKMPVAAHHLPAQDWRQGPRFYSTPVFGERHAVPRGRAVEGGWRDYTSTFSPIGGHISVSTTAGRGACGTEWVEAKAVARHPLMHQAAQPQRLMRPQKVQKRWRLPRFESRLPTSQP